MGYFAKWAVVLVATFLLLVVAPALVSAASNEAVFVGIALVAATPFAAVKAWQLIQRKVNRA